MAKYIKSLKYKNPQGSTSGEITTVNGDVIANITGPNGVTYTRNLSDIDDISMSSHSTISGTSESSPYSESRTYTVSGGMGDYYRYSISETGDGTATASVSSSGNVSLTISVSGTGTHSGTISLGVGSRGDAVSNGTLAQRTMNKTFSIPYNLKIEDSSSVDFPMDARIFLAGPEIGTAEDNKPWSQLLPELFLSCIQVIGGETSNIDYGNISIQNGIGSGSEWLDSAVNFIADNFQDMEMENSEVGFVFVITSLYDDEKSDIDSYALKCQEWYETLTSEVGSLGVTFLFIDCGLQWNSYTYFEDGIPIRFVNLSTLPDQSDWEFLLENNFSSSGAMAEFTGGGQNAQEFDNIAFSRGSLVSCVVEMYNGGFPSYFIDAIDNQSFLGWPVGCLSGYEYQNANGLESIKLIIPIIGEDGSDGGASFLWSCSANHVDGSASYWAGLREDGWTGEAESTYLWEAGTDEFVEYLSQTEDMQISFEEYRFFVSMKITPDVVNEQTMAIQWQYRWGDGGNPAVLPAFLFVDGIGCGSTWKVLGMTNYIDFASEYVLPFGQLPDSALLFREKLDYISLLVSPGVLKVTSLLIHAALVLSTTNDFCNDLAAGGNFEEALESATNGTLSADPEPNMTILNTSSSEVAQRTKSYGQIKPDLLWDSSLTNNTGSYSFLKIMPKVWGMQDEGTVAVECNLPNYCAVNDPEPYFNFRRTKAGILESPPI